jgi:site-specific recombinase XerD
MQDDENHTGPPFTTVGFAKLIEGAGIEAGFKFGTHPHVLRHSCGYKLANDGHDTRSLQASESSGSCLSWVAMYTSDVM